MKKIITLFIMVQFTVMAFAQDISREFGDVKMTDFNVKPPETEVNADALVIFDIGESEFINSARRSKDILFKRRTRVKIFNNAGVDHAIVSIPYYIGDDDMEQVTLIEAYSVNIEDGVIKKTKLDLTTVYEEVKNRNWKYKKFAIPNVRPGSVIEYRYEIVSPYKFNFRDWEFQRRIPTLYSKYIVKMDPFYQYYWVLQGAEKFSTYKEYKGKRMPTKYGVSSYQNMIYEFIMTDVSSYKEEPLSTGYDDLVIKIDYQLASVSGVNEIEREIISTWKSLISELLRNKYFGKFIKASGRQYKEIEEGYNLVKMSQRHKADFLINYVKQNFAFNKEHSILTYENVGEFLDNKEGNSAEINLYLAGLMKKAGIDAEPVIISTKDHGKIKTEYPFLNYFNHVVVLVNIDGKSFVTDASEINCSNRILPPKCINDLGLVIKKGKEKWINTISDSKSYEIEKYKIKVSENKDSVDVEGLMIFSKHKGLHWRNTFQEDKEVVENYWNSKSVNDINDVVIINFKDKRKNYIVGFKGKYPIETVKSKIILNALGHDDNLENPFESELRKYPVNFPYKSVRKIESKILIPEGYTVKSIPEKVEIDNEIVKISYIPVMNGDGECKINFSYEFKQLVYDVSVYDKLKSYYEIIINKINEKIVIERQNE